MKLFEVLKPLLENKVDYILKNQAEQLYTAATKDHSFSDPSSVKYSLDDLKREYDHRIAQDHITTVAERILKLLENIDPTPNNKYLQWLVNRYIERTHFLIVEDAESTSNVLKLFHEHKNNLHKKDINQYKSLSELSEAVRQFRETGADSVKEQKLLAEGQAEIVFDDGTNQIIVPKTAEASRYYALEKYGTDWCTAYPDMFKEYSSDGPLYIIAPKDLENFSDRVMNQEEEDTLGVYNYIYQVHFESDKWGDNKPDTGTPTWQVKDVSDDEVRDRTALYSNNSAFKFLVDIRVDYLRTVFDGITEYTLWEVYWAIQDEFMKGGEFVEIAKKAPEEFEEIVRNNIDLVEDHTTAFIITKEEAMQILGEGDGFGGEIQYIDDEFFIDEEEVLNTLATRDTGILFDSLKGDMVFDDEEELSSLSFHNVRDYQEQFIEHVKATMYIEEHSKDYILSDETVKEDFDAIMDIEDLFEFIYLNDNDAFIRRLKDTMLEIYTDLLHKSVLENAKQVMNERLFQKFDIQYDSDHDLYEVSSELAFDIYFDTFSSDPAGEYGDLRSPYGDLVDISIEDMHEVLRVSVDLERFMNEL